MARVGDVRERPPWRWQEGRSQHAVIPSVFSDDELQNAYTNNLGYLVLGQVIEQTGSVSVEHYIAENVLQPLEMRHTGFIADPESRRATPYQRRGTAMNAVLPVLVPRRLIGRNEGRFRSLEHFYLDGAAYGGLVGSTSDATRFVQAHRRGGELDGNRILSQESAKAMRTMAASGRKFRVGFGWYQRGPWQRRTTVQQRRQLAA